jgi:hypothetical protein
MFSWVELALALIKGANALLTWARERELISEGQDKAIAQASAEILVNSQFAKSVMQRMSALNEQQTDDVLKQLGAA